MSALTDLFSSMANKIRSKVGGSDTYTPTEMVSAIDDVYDAGIADATTDITPSDASPAAMLANLGYKPTTNGYAIESYKTVNPQTVIIDNIDTSKVYKFSQTGIIIDNFDKNIIPSNVNPASFSSADKCFMTDSGYAISSYDSVTPSSTPESVSSGDIVKIGGSGKIVDAISDVTPSDSSPVSLTSGLTYKMGGGGYAIESQPTTLTPRDYSSPTITSGTIYKAADDGVAVSSVIEVTSSDNFPYPVGRGKIVRNMIGVGIAVTGYIIDSYTEKVPNDTTPPSVSVGDIVKIKTNGGYLYASQQSGFDYLTTKTISVSNKTASLTGLTSGKEYYMFVSYAWTNTNYNAEISSMTNTTNLTKVDSGRDRPTSSLAAYENWSLYTFKASSTSSTITFSTTATSAFTARVLLFEK